MALVKSVLKAEIKSALQEMFNTTENPQAAMETYAEKLSTAIDNYIKSGDVNTTVITAGSPTSHTGTGTGKVS